MTNSVADKLESQLCNTPYLLDRDNLKLAISEIRRLQDLVDTHSDSITLSVELVESVTAMLNIAVINPFEFSNLQTHTQCAHMVQQLNTAIKDHKHE